MTFTKAQAEQQHYRTAAAFPVESDQSEFRSRNTISSLEPVRENALHLIDLSFVRSERTSGTNPCTDTLPHTHVIVSATQESTDQLQHYSLVVCHKHMFFFVCFIAKACNVIGFILRIFRHSTMYNSLGTLQCFTVYCKVAHCGWNLPPSPGCQSDCSDVYTTMWSHFITQLCLQLC